MRTLRLLPFLIVCVALAASQTAKPAAAAKPAKPAASAKTSKRPAIAKELPHYQLINKYEVGGDGGWDYLFVEPTQHRLYIGRTNRAMVFDLDAGKMVGEVPAGQGVHGVAIALDLNKGYISNGRDNNVTVFDLKTLKPTGTVSTGQNPDAIIYNPVTKQVLTMNGRSGDITVINTKDDTVAGTIPVGEKVKLEFAAVDGQGYVYVNVEDKGELAKVDSKNLKLLSRWQMEGCEEPSGLAIQTMTPKKGVSWLYSVCGNKTMVITDGEVGKQIGKAPIGQGVDGVAFDPKSGMAFSANGRDGTLTAVHTGDNGKTFDVAQTVDSIRSARTITYDAKTGNVVSVGARFGDTPAATAENPRPRPQMVPGSFTILVFGPK